MTIKRMKMTIIQYRSCWHNLTVTGRWSLWPCVVVDLGRDAPAPGLNHGGDTGKSLNPLLKNVALIVYLDCTKHLYLNIYIST